MKTNLLAVSLAVVTLSGFSAFADEWDNGGWDNNGWDNNHSASPVGASSCPTAPPQGYQSNQGKYELQTTQQWVPGGYVQVYQQPVCSTEYRGRYGRHVRQHCTGGGYVSQWVDAHYEARQQWVWVQYQPRYPQPQVRPSGWGRRGPAFGVSAGPGGVRFHVNGQL